MSTETSIWRKRSRDEDASAESATYRMSSRPSETDPNKKLRFVTSDTSSGSSYFIAHRVVCDSKERYHERHATNAYYFDVPRLTALSNRKSCLQGQTPLANLESYLEDNIHLSFAVCYTYSCNGYHEMIKDDFKRLQMPRMDDDIAIKSKPYFYVLESDAERATAKSHDLLLSEGFKKALHLLGTKAPGFQWNWEDSSNLAYPYLQLYHQREYLAGLATIGSNSPHYSHMKALQNYLVDCLGPEYTEAETLFKEGLVDKKHWNKLYRPGAVLVAFAGGEVVAYICNSCPISTHNSLHLRCHTWEFDGKFYQNRVTLDIKWPSTTNNAIAITDLELYPIAYAEEGLEDALRTRGQTFWTCRLRKFINYSVPLEGMEVQIANLRYMVDMNSYNMMDDNDDGEEPPSVTRDELSAEDMLIDELPAEPFVLLLPSRIRGYGFHNKKWTWLLVKHISDIQWSKEVFEDRLVLPEDKKELIRALITVHAGKEAAIRTEFMAGKGDGLIILLHGGPGTGKTLTAESVAELAHRPLYRVTCGDIGTEPQAVEEYLKSVLWIGSTWRCVVLLDEADVFLEQREKMDMKRNAVVSVFLRVLEYYDGILILTTNRIGTFDEAFKSRIQLALHYPPLNEEDRTEVWRNFLQSLEGAGETANFDEIRNKLPILGRYKLNGRQIRNTITNARQLALHQNQSLRFVHVSQALKAVMDFEKHVTELHGHDDEDYARDMRTR